MDLSKLSDKQLEIALKVAKAAEKQGLNPDFVLPMVMVESGFDDKATSKKGAKGVMQLMPETAKALGVNSNDVDENIEGGVRLLKELVSNKKIGDDPYKVLAAYNTSTETRNKFLESGDLTVLPDETINHMLKVSERFGGELPQVVAGAKPEEKKEEPAQDTPVPQVDVGEEVVDDTEKAPNTRVPRALTGLAGAAAGATAGAGAAIPAAALRAKYDAAQLIASYPDAMAAFKAGKSPSEVLNIALQHTAPSPRPELPTAGGPLTGTPAGGRMTQNWVGSQDAEGRYTDVGMKARDQAEAHQMKRAAMAAEDKIGQIAPEFRADPNRANLFIPQSAGRGPSPRFGGTPTAPIPPVAPVAAQTPTVMSGLGALARHYTPYLKWPVMGGLTGLAVGQGAADIYNRAKEGKKGEAAISAAGTAASVAAPLAGTAASIPLAGAGALLPAYLYMQDNPEAKERFIKGMSGKSAYANRGFGLD